MYTLFIVIAFATLSFLMLQFPQVQTYLVHRYLAGFSGVVGFPTTVESMELKWYDRLDLKNVKITDPEKNTMISVGKLAVNFELLSLMKNGNVNIDAVDINHAEVNLKSIAESDTSKNLNINLFIKKINEKYSSGGGGSSSAKLNIGEIGLDNSQFIYNEAGSDSIQNGFDYRHFHLDLDNGNINAFQVIGDTIQFNVNSLRAQDRQTKFTIHELSTYFRISQSSMEFLNINLKAGKSTIADTVIFTYHSQDDLSDFNDKVNILAKLKNTVLDPHDLFLFTYGLPLLPQSVSLSGAASGKVSRFAFKPMTIAMGRTKVHGTLVMDGLPNINETFIDLHIKDGKIEQSDIEFLLSESTYKALKPFGHTRANADFTGFVNDFVAKGNLLTQLGSITTDVNLKIKKGNEELSEFSGNLALTNFNLGAYLKDTINYQNVTLDGHIHGKGLSRSTSDFVLTGKINSFGFRNYNYTNITTNARFARQLFNGDVAIDDPNLQFSANAFIDFRKGKELIQVKANLDSALIDKLGLIKEPLFVQSYFDVNTSGLNLDSLQGKIFLKHTLIHYQTKKLKLDSVDLTSERTGQLRQLKLRSSIADISLVGNYRYPTLIADIKKLGLDFYSKFNHNKEFTPDQSIHTPIKPYEANLNVLVHTISPLAQLADINISLSPETVFKGHYSQGQRSSISITGKIDTLIYNKKIFSGNDWAVSGYRHNDSTDMHAQVKITSASQTASSSFKTKNLLASVAWNANLINMGLNVEQEGNNNQLQLKSLVELMQDSLRLKILPSTLQIFNEAWTFAPENYAMIKGKEWHIHRMGISHAGESVSLNGSVSEDPNAALTLSINQLDIDIINSLVQEKVSGLVQGEVQARDLYHDPFLQSKVFVQNLMVQDFLVGNVTGINQWDRERQLFNVNFYLDRDSKRAVDIEGNYDPKDESPLQLKAKLEGANVKTIEPFMRGIFSDMNGTLTGNYSITGTFSEPKINGEGKIESGSLVIDYLKTKYTFSGMLDFTPREITFKKFSLTDELNSKGKLDGFISHRNFNDMRLNLSASFDKFQVMNTSAKDNSLFYGQAYATGNLKMEGPINNLNISATAKSAKGTRVFIPLNGSTDNTATKKEFISFANFSDTLKVEKNKHKPRTKTESTGITMDLNLDITPDAYSEIIFDIRSGDIIRGYGNGNLKLQFDTKGEFSMYGDYTFDHGNYNFTLYDIINKEFVINKGSKISWAGDPYTAVLTINAGYRQLVSFSPIISNQDPNIVNSPQMRRKYPCEVQLKLDGPMMSPQINFDIVATDLPNSVPISTATSQNYATISLNNEFKAFKAQLNEQELKKQVFSLIMLRRFSPQDAFATLGGSGLYNSVSELLSNQLSYWLTQVDQNLEVNFDLGNFDQEAFNTFQLRLSYSFLNGRLRVTRDGAFNNQYNRSDVSNMLGDWTVDYLLTPDGTLKIKMFNRTNVNQLTSSFGGQTIISTGFSLMSTKSFNSWKELLNIAHQRRRKEVEEQIKKENDGTK